MKRPMTVTTHKRMLGRYLFGDKRIKKRSRGVKSVKIDVRKAWKGVVWVNYV